MKKLFLLVAVVAIALSGCVKLEESIENLENRVDILENTTIPSIEEQIESLSRVTAELEQVYNELQKTISALKSDIQANAKNIAVLETQTETLETRITALNNYVDSEIQKAKDAASAAYATIDALNEAKNELNALQTTVTGLSTEINTKIDSAVASLSSQIDQAVKTINDKIADLEARLKVVEDKIENLLSRIQSISYIPTYSDGKATVEYTTLKSNVTLNFEISPKETVAELAKVWDNIISVRAIYTKTRVVEFIDMPLKIFKADEQNGIISVTASGENLSKEFYSGAQDASVSLVISDENNSVVSEYIPMLKKLINKDIDEAVAEISVTPTSIETYGGEYVINISSNGSWVAECAEGDIETPTDNGNGNATIRIPSHRTDRIFKICFEVQKQTYIPIFNTWTTTFDQAEVVISQMATDALGSGSDLLRFSKAWNEGEDVSEWMVDGVFNVRYSMNCSDIEDWIPIGTKERPFTGVFNGNNHKIINLKGSQPLFGYCKDATISDIIIDKTSEISYVGSFDTELHLASLAYVIENTTIKGCVNNASVSLDAYSNADECCIYAGGLIARTDASSTVMQCTNMGAVSVPNSCTTIADQGYFYVGGLVGYNEGTIEDSFNNGAIKGSAQVTTTYLGGVAGYNAISSGILRNNLNAGALDYKASRGSNVSLYAYVGGITGVGNGEISGNTNEGDITSTSNVQNLYMGGIVGAILEPNAKLQNNTNANASDATATGKALHTYVGGLAGYVSDEASLSFDFTSDSGVFAGSIFAGNAEANKSAIIAAGGFIGYTESALSINGLNYEGTITMDISDVTSGDYYTFGGLVGRAAAPLTITSSTTTGSMPVTATTTIPTTKITIGGIVGLCETDVTVKGCTNNMPIEYAKAAPSKSNGVISHLGGIVGRVYSGKTHIEDCHNKGKITNRLYNNNLLHDLGGTTTGKIAVAAGVLGSYGYLIDAESTDSAIVKDCTNITAVEAYRGGVAGVVGYIRNGVIDGCTYLNGRSDSQNNSYAGGIVCIADDTIIRGCKATADLVSKPAGSLYIRCGGIAAWTRGATTVENCQFYGTLKYTASVNDDFCGGIIALAEDEECVVKDCSYGGNVNGVTISENNCAEHAVGAGSLGNFPIVAQISGIEYWNGK